MKKELKNNVLLQGAAEQKVKYMSRLILTFTTDDLYRRNPSVKLVSSKRQYQH